jgi:hypothetical protein
MARKLTHNRANVRAAIMFMESLGKTVSAIKLHPDGTFRVMTSAHVSRSRAQSVIGSKPSVADARCRPEHAEG